MFDPAGAGAADPKAPWSNQGSLSYVAVGGHASSQSMGIANEYKYFYGDAAVVTESSTTTTEGYYATLRYDHDD